MASDQYTARHDNDTGLERDNEDVTLSAVAARLWAGKLYIVGGAVLGLLASIIYLDRATFFYTASMKVTAAPSSQSSGSRGGGLGGLASLAGVSLGGNAAGASPFEIYLETLSSEDVARRLARDPKIMRTIFAGDWDVEQARWRKPELGAKASLVRSVKRTLGIPVKEWRVPDERELAGFLASQIGILRDARSPIVGITLDHPDPRFARELLAATGREADRLIRESVLSRSRSYANYLERKLPTVTIAEQRAALIEALSEQEKSIMMASSTGPFAATVISGPVVSSLPTKPSASMAVVAMTVAGLLLGAVMALVDWRKWRRAMRRDTAA